MSSFVKMATFAVTLHIVFYVAMNLIYVPDTTTGAVAPYRTLGVQNDIYRFEPDLFTQFVSTNPVDYTEKYKDNWTEYYTLNTTLLSIPAQSGGEAIGTNVISFLDSLKIVYPVLNTMLNIGIGPLAILTSNKINPIISALIGGAYAIIIFFAVIAFIRGVSD